MKYMDAINLALQVSLEGDPRVYVAGIDVGAAGGIFRVTAGLQQRFGPERVIDTPIAESALVGMAVGSAMAGLRPVIEIMFIDFLGVCFDQVINQAAKLRFMTGGLASVPLVIRTQFGAGRSSAAQHSQSLEGLVAAIPGLEVVMPATPADAYGLLRSAILSPNPVIFIEHRHLYGTRGPAPQRDHLVPMGKAAVVRPGRDVTLVATGRLVHEGLAAAAALARQGIDVEVIDLRSIVPLDTETLAESVTKTGRLAVAHEAPAFYGPGNEVIASVIDHAFWHLDAPPVRITPPATPAPYAPEVERQWLPDRHRIVAELQRLAQI
jgi:2-oxoisovalerate dehydrogenase E1 component